MIQLSVQDSTFLAMEQPDSPMNGGVVFVYDGVTESGAVTFQDVVDHFQDRLHLVPVLRKKLIRTPGNLTRPYWIEEKNIDLEYHIQNSALPSPGDWQRFCSHVSRLIARPLDLTRPLWELHMIEGLDAVEKFSPGSFALILKVHHAGLDGHGFLTIMNILHSLKPNAELTPASDAAIRPSRSPSSVGLLVRAGVEASKAPFETFSTVKNALPGLSQMLKSKFEAKPKNKTPAAATPATRFNRSVGPHRSWGACLIDLEKTKLIRQCVEGSTVNDIAITVFGGALRSYLKDAGELPTESLKTGIVVNVRTDQDDQGLGNQLAGMIASLGTDIADPLERLAAVRASTKRTKQTASTVKPRSMAELLELIPEMTLSPVMNSIMELGNRAGRGLFSIFNTAVTGMAGPPKPLYLGAAKMTHLIGFGPVTDGLGLINIQQSYNGEFVLTFTADREAVPDPERYEQCIYTAFDELYKAAGAESRKSAPAKKSKKKRAKAGRKSKVVRKKSAAIKKTSTKNSSTSVG